MEEFFIENKRKIITFGIIVLVTIIFTIVNSLSSKKGNAAVFRKKNLKELGERYYTEILYPIYKDNIEEYADTGFRVTLYDIASKTNNDMNDIFKLFSDDKTTCNLVKTYLIIYPKKPYKKDNMEFKINLSCDMDKNKVSSYEK